AAAPTNRMCSAAAPASLSWKPRRTEARGSCPVLCSLAYARGASQGTMCASMWVGVRTMRLRPRFLTITAGVLMLAAACAPTSSSGGPGAAPAASPGQAQPQAAAPKKIVAAVNSQPYALNAMLGGYLGSAPGMEALGAMVNSGFIIVDNAGNPQPIIAEAAPSIEDGTWKLNPDGTMTTTWTIRQGAVWQDGVPVTSDDFAFTLQLAHDKSLLIFQEAQYDLIDSIETPDPRTVIAHWSQPFIYANLAFGYANDVANLPLPKHLLQTAYEQSDFDHFIGLPYWTSDFVGNGPYKLHEWVPSVHVSFDANDSFVLGRPKIDQVDVLFITDQNTELANLLSG